VTHYGADGTVMQEKDDQSLAGANRVVKQASDFAMSSVLGQVIIAGGYHSGKTSDSSYQFSSSTSTFQNTGSLKTPRYGHTATLLQNNQILIAGGRNGSTVLRSAEIYHPDGGNYLPAPGTMKVARLPASATRCRTAKC